MLRRPYIVPKRRHTKDKRTPLVIFKKEIAACGDVRNMLFRRNEPKKGHPLCTLAVVAMTVIGTCAVIRTTGQKMTDMCSSMKKLFCFKKKPSCGCHTVSTDVCPVCGEPLRENA